MSLLTSAPTVSALAPAPHDGQGFFHGSQRRVKIALVFNDIPLGPAGGLANMENRLPVQFIVADDRVRFGPGKGFLVEADVTPLVSLETGDRIRPARGGVAGIKLNDD